MRKLLRYIFTKDKKSSEPLSSQIIDPYETKNLDSYFAERFTDKGGIFTYVESESEGLGVLQNILELLSPDHIYCRNEKLETYLSTLKYDYQFHSTTGADVCLIDCESLVALDGSILVSSDNIGELKIPDLPNNIIVWSFTDQLCSNKSKALENLKRTKPNKIPTNITSINPKKSQDFLKNNYLKEIYLLLIES